MAEFFFNKAVFQAFFDDVVSGDRNVWSSPENHEITPSKIMKWLDHENIKSELLEFTFYDIKGKNVWIPPPAINQPFYLIIAHYDTVPNCPGFDDNGSGLGILFMIAKWYHDNLSVLTEKYNLNLAFVFSDHEEGDPRDFLYFDDFAATNDKINRWEDIANEDHWMEYVQYMDHHIENRTLFVGAKMCNKHMREIGIFDNLKLVIDLETVGCTNSHQKHIPNSPIRIETGDFLAIAINDEAKDWIAKLLNLSHKRKIVTLPLPGQGHPLPDSRRGEHAVYWDMGIDAMLWTDTANFRNPDYHLPSDTNIDLDFISDVFEILVSLLISS